MARKLGVLATALVAFAAACSGSPLTPDGAPGTAGTGAVDGGGGSGSGDGTNGGGGGTGAGGGVPADLCSLLTVDEVGGALSTDPLTASGSGGGAEVPTCHYLLAAGGLALQVTSLGGAQAEEWLRQARDNPSNDPIEGVGDEAFYNTADRRLVFWQDGVMIQLRAVYASDADTTLRNLESLAGIVLARLGGGSVPPELQITAPPVVAAQNACDLLSAEEAAAIIKVGELTATANESTPTFCYFNLASGEPVLTTYLDRKGGLAVWETVDDYGGERVTGLGNDAWWEEFEGRLSVLSGDTIINVQLYSTLAAEEILALDRQLIEVMLSHL